MSGPRCCWKLQRASTQYRVASVQRTRGFRGTTEQQQRYLARRAFDSVEMPLIAAGLAPRSSAPDGREQRLEVFDSGGREPDLLTRRSFLAWTTC
jgi:hypothetical protein